MAFWVVLHTSEGARAALELIPAEPQVTDAFVVADLGVVALSVLGSYAVLRRRRWAASIAAAVAGGIAYPTLFLVGWLALTGDGGELLAIMIPPTALSTWVALETWRLGRSPRPADHHRP